jgi:hypothetical protein
MRDRFKDVRQVHRFVAAAGWFRLQIARQQVGSIGFDHEPVRREVSHDLAQMMAATLIADPARDSDVEAELQIGARLFDACREAMGDAARQSGPEVTQDRDEVLVRIALMQKHRLSHTDRKIELPLKRRTLYVAR